MSYSEDFKIFVATINGEAENCSETSWKVIAHTMRNRVGFANWKSWSTIIQIVTKTGYDAYTQKNSPYKRAKKALDSGDISPKLMSLIKAVEPIFNGTEPDFTGGVVYYYSPKAQAQLHKSDPSNYPSLVPDFVVSKSNPTQQVQIPGTEKDDMRWYKVLTSIFDVSFVDNAGNPLVGVTVDVVYNDKKPVPLFKDLITDQKGKIKKVRVCNYMGARFKVNGVLVKDKNNKEISLLGDGKNYASVIVVNNGKGGIKSKTDIHNQESIPGQKQESVKIDSKAEVNNEKKAEVSDDNTKQKNVNFSIKVIDSENKAIPNFSYFLKYKNAEKKHSVGANGIENNLVALSGEEITVLISGLDSKQEIIRFTAQEGMGEKTIKLNLHTFNILFRHKDTKKPITNLNLIQKYRNQIKQKKTDGNGKITVSAMPGFELNYKLRDERNLLTIKVDKNKSLRVIDVDSSAIEQASKNIKIGTKVVEIAQSKQPVPSSKQKHPVETHDSTPKRDEKVKISTDGHPKTLVNDNGETEFIVYTYDQKTNQLFSGGNYSIEYKGNKKRHSSGIHGIGKKIHKGEIGQKIKITASSGGKEFIAFDGNLSRGMKAFELKIDRSVIPSVSDVIISFKGVNEQSRQAIVSQKTKNVLAYLAKEANMDKLYITSTIRTPRAQAEAMYIKATKYAKPGEDVKKVKAECIAKGLGKEATIQKMVEKIVEFQNKGVRVSKHCVSEEQYRKNNIIDLGTNSNGFGTGNTLNSVGKRFKAVCEKALKDGIISGFISADVAGEGAMHIEIIQ
ncbi:hypothetical protein ABTA49_07180 [Acinetobacter baumannii]|uniref:hypothetical protein n=1 Tax=Acinetobacter baumannii TaxID=470 RepID=UPI001EECEC4A|nr:hypothetical protein [Acinetobacter baumannii]HAV5337427.1 hypothetical protein [Acinetobacter baumannii]HAV5342485.1 hypothetical protein [Acinetobacter baumannii]HAV5509731.1 hypothetical protein [Acinetobacter baumannii]HAV5556766.1 hypothetical protein [Acinetobacter baumannii]